MVNNKAVRELASYIEKYHPEVLLIVRPEDSEENRMRGYVPGQPDIMILEQRLSYTGLALWAKPKLTKSEIRFLRRLSGVGYDTGVTEDSDDLRLHFLMHMAKCGDPRRTDSRQLEIIEVMNHGITRHPTCSGAPNRDTLRRVSKFVKKEFPSAVMIPGLGADDKPTLTIIKPEAIHNGLAIWMGDICTLSDKQLGYMKMMAGRSYITVASEDYHYVHAAVFDYMHRAVASAHPDRAPGTVLELTYLIIPYRNRAHPPLFTFGSFTS